LGFFGLKTNHLAILTKTVRLASSLLDRSKASLAVVPEYAPAFQGLGLSVVIFGLLQGLIAFLENVVVLPGTLSSNV
jgi:hypothetical protein